MREFVPNVIEPSFGLGRILYSLLEHSYWAREQDKARGVLSFPPLVAPIKCLIVTISQDPTLRNLIHEICKQSLSHLDLNHADEIQPEKCVGWVSLAAWTTRALPLERSTLGMTSSARRSAAPSILPVSSC